MHRHIAWVIIAHALLRIAGGTSGILIGLYLAGLNNRGVHTSAALVGTLSAVSFAAELFASIPMGLASDALHPRWLMAGGALMGAVAAVLFAMSGSTAVFYVSRTLEGLGAAAVVPALLAYLADATEDRPALRVRAMSYFELTLLAGLALGGIFAAQLFRELHAGAFAAVALVYLACAVILVLSVSGKMARKIGNPLADLRDVLRRPSLRHLAPVWLCVNAIVGLWLGPMLPFLLTKHAASNQYLAGIYATDPARVGWLLLGYALVFGAGITAWSFVLPHVRLKAAMNITLATMLPVCAGIYLLNHSAHQPTAMRWIVGGVTALMIMVESGFTPAALAWLAQALPIEAGRGAAMGVYSVLLSIGAILGSLLAALLGQLYSIDGLLDGTVLVAVAALVFLRWVPTLQPLELENA
ncbi:MAG: MFS transporter [Candidatus Baltobacteraceae bacterium]